MADDLPQLTQRLADAIQNADPSGLVTRWVALVETIDADGHRALLMTAQDGMKVWDSLGMLQHAIHTEQAATVVAQLADWPPQV